MNSVLKASIALAIGLAMTTRAQTHKYDEWDENYTVQALLGAVRFEDLEFKVEEGQTQTADLSTIPQIGGAWGTLPKGNRFQYGLEATFLFGFRTKDLEYLIINSSGLRAKVSTSLWMFDLAGGAYVNLFLDPGKKIRLYGAAGPLLMYADYDADKEYSDDSPDEDTSESAFGIGVYARSGIEFRVHERGTLGLGARATWADVDFSDVGGTTDMKGIAGFVTYTAGF